MLKPTITVNTPLRGLKKAGFMIALGVLVAASLTSPLVRADQFDDQIRALQNQNAQTQDTITSLEAQASSLQDVVNQLQSQIYAIQAQIAQNEAQQAKLQAEIEEKKQQIAREKAILGEDLRTMYVDGQMSTIEELATSKSLSEYVDKQTYREAVQSKIQTTLKEIAALQVELQRQKTEVDQLLESEKTQNAQLAADQAQQQYLLSLNENQQATYNAQISANSSKIGELRRQQAIENARYNIGSMKGGGAGGYPAYWANAAQDTIVDDWGMYNRECVSYTAYRVHQDFLAGRDRFDMPWWGGIGNANQWDDNARNEGIPVDYTPTPGSIAISNSGTWGHAMYVMAVNGDTIYVGQYNADFTGHYSEGWRYTTGLVFIHF